MDVFEMVVVIVALSVTAGLINNWIKTRATMTVGPAGMTPTSSSAWPSSRSA
jgi:hypothetical protein